MFLVDYFISQAVIEMLEKQIPHLEKLKQYAGIEYIRERIAFFENRCDEIKSGKSKGLSVSESGELHSLVSYYCVALEKSNPKSEHEAYYISYVNQVRDKLTVMLEQREFAQ